MNIVILGYFGENNKKIIDGQSIKTKNLVTLLSKKHNIETIDTCNWKKHPISLLLKILKYCRKQWNFIILPAQNGVKFFPKILLFFKKIYKKIKIYYSVIGGWLPQLLKSNNKLLKTISKLNGVWVETETMYLELQNLNLKNVHLVNNYKKINQLNEESLSFDIPIPPFRFAVFSRINKIKGISDLIYVINKINLPNKFVVDIYGPVDDDYLSEFNESIKNISNINYKGCVESSQSVTILKDYFMLIFPTRYKGEGTPGTIIDAMCAGIPVIASKWPSYLGVVNSKNAILYDFEDIAGLENAILYCINNPKIIVAMKKDCLKESNKYSEKTILSQIEKAMI